MPVIANMFVLVHKQPARKVQPRPSLQESYRRHEMLMADLVSLAAETSHLRKICGNLDSRGTGFVRSLTCSPAGWNKPLQLFDPIQNDMDLVRLAGVDHQELSVREHVERDVSGGVQPIWLIEHVSRRAERTSLWLRPQQP